MPGSGKKLFADWLLVELPSVKFETEFATEDLSDVLPENAAGRLLPEFDLGESHLFLMLQG